MSTSFSNVINFFRECYVADNRENVISDIFQKKFELKQFFKEEEIPTSENQIIELLLPNSYGEEIAQASITYKREKELIYGQCFVAGRVKSISTFSKSKSRTICGPLLLYKARLLKREERLAVQFNPLDFDLNVGILKEWVEDKDLINQLEIDIENRIQTTKGSVVEIVLNWFRVNVLDKEIILESNNLDQEQIKSLRNKRNNTVLTLFNCNLLSLVKRSSNSRGILHDLELLSACKEISSPLKQLFLNKTIKTTKSRPCDFQNIPSVLSDAQKNILSNASKETVSIVLGPPGTGKSYTIASIALDRYMQNESVLIVSRNEHAVNVVSDKLVDTMGLSEDILTRLGNHTYLAKLKGLLKDILSGWHDNEIKPVYNELRDLLNQENQLKKVFESKSKRIVKTGEGKVTNFWDRVKYFLSSSTLHNKMLFELMDDIQVNRFKRNQLLSTHLNNNIRYRIKEVLQKNRKILSNFLSGIRARTSKKQEDVFKNTNFKTLLQAFPIWLGTLEALHKALPLENELFDLVIIDESTQCDISSCLPALQRAKRAVIVGDYKQLRHISFLSGAKQDVFKKKYGLENFNFDLNYRDNSMIDLASQGIASQSAVITLNEHYRSLPKIIEFSNKNFYNEGLRIMTERPLQKTEAVEVRQVEGERINGVNEQEAKEVLKTLKGLIQNQNKIPIEFKDSIGVLSFFREQVDCLQTLIDEELSSEEIENHQIRIGTPYHFQGEEKSIMLISCAVDQNTSHSVLSYLNKPEVLNVSITRAQNLQVLFLSREIDSIPSKYLFRTYLDSISIKNRKEKNPFNFSNKEVLELVSELKQLKINVFQGYSIAKLEIDLVLEHEGNVFAIDLIGFEDKYKEAFDLERYMVFNRAGLVIVPLGIDEWLTSKDKVLEKIKELFGLIVPDKANSDLNTLSYWQDLLSINTDLAHKVKALEIELLLAKDKENLDQLGVILNSYQSFLDVISNQLDKEEITHKRYTIAIENLMGAIFGNMRKSVLLKKGIPLEVSPELRQFVEEQNQQIQALADNNRKAIDQIQQITLSWSQLANKEVDKTSFANSIKELSSLREQINNYNN